MSTTTPQGPEARKLAQCPSQGGPAALGAQMAGPLPGDSCALNRCGPCPAPREMAVPRPQEMAPPPGRWPRPLGDGCAPTRQGSVLHEKGKVTLSRASSEAQGTL